MADDVPLVDVLCRDEAAAVAALEAAGCAVEEGLSMTVDHPMLGTIHRVFGVVQNAANLSSPTNPSFQQTIGSSNQTNTAEERGTRFVERILRMLDSPDNDRLTQQLTDGRLDYLPGNKRIAVSARKVLGDGGAHLPWGLQPLNLDLAAKVQRQCKRYGFVVFYSRAATLPVGSPPVVSLRRVFSTPFGVAGFGTWQEPISADILDEDVGLVLEANWLAPAK